MPDFTAIFVQNFDALSIRKRVEKLACITCGITPCATYRLRPRFARKAIKVITDMADAAGISVRIFVDSDHYHVCVGSADDLDGWAGTPPKELVKQINAALVELSQ